VTDFRLGDRSSNMCRCKIKLTP